MWVVTVQTGVAPWMRGATTKSRSRSDIAVLRATRAYPTQNVAASVTTMSHTLGPSAADIAMRTRMTGIASCTSAHAMRALSRRPPA